MTAMVARDRVRFSMRGASSRRARPAVAVFAVLVCLLAGGAPGSFVALAAAASPSTITSISPSDATIGTQIVISGTRLRLRDAPVVTLNKLGSATRYEMAVVSVEPRAITVRVMAVDGPGVYKLRVTYGERTKLVSPQNLVIHAPSQLNAKPDVGQVGSKVTLSASFLGSAPGTVTVGKETATIISWQGTRNLALGRVQFKIPAALRNGAHHVRVTNAVGETVLRWGLVVVGKPDSSNTELRLSNAAATSNTQVLVQFSKPVDPRKAGLPEHYRITGTSGGATVTVVSAVVERPSLTTVRLETRPQSEVEYKLKAVDIVDLSGNPIAAPSGPLPADPSATTFVGIGPSRDGQVDSDGDGVTDADEQRGYTIEIRSASGSITKRAVTSNPSDPDTDDDGVSDGEERHAASDPRSPDTDGDTLTDNLEWNILLSNPADQDTDSDSIQDGFEYCCLGTSPLLDDTDGDQIGDAEEVFSRNRNPLIADLPAHTISIGDLRLQLDQRFTYVDETGRTVSTTESAASSLESASTSTRSDGFNQTLGGSVWVEGGLRDGTDTMKPFFRAHGEFNGSQTTEWSQETVVATQRAYQQSLEKASELSATSSVTREVLGADIAADVTIANKGNLAFSIGRLEITVLQRSADSTFRLVPVATLVANSGADTTFNLGPFNRTRGPVLFSTKEIFPNLVEQLMQNPGSLVFSVANFDMTDELGRHFTYSEQIARDRTGGILIDAGDGNVERHLVATSLQADPDRISGADYVGGFKANGSPIGIPLDFALQHMLGMKKNSTVPDGIISTDHTASSRARGDDVQLIPRGTTGLPVGSIIIAAGANGVLDTTPTGADTADVTTGYATQRIRGVETLVRVGSQRNGDLNRQWFVGSSLQVPAGADFGKLHVKPGQDFYFVFVQDLDQDGLFARQEFLAGSTDSKADVYDNSSFGRIDPVLGQFGYRLQNPVATADGIADSKDTDRDGLGDFAELRVGWKVSANGETLQQVFSSPRLPDSDGDGLLDPQEQDLRGFCATADPRQDALCAFQSAPTVLRGEAIAIIAGANGTANTPAAGDDVQAIPRGTRGLTFATVVIRPGANGVIDSTAAGDDEYQSNASSRNVPPASNPLRVDTDFDALTDFDELQGLTVGLSIRDGGAACDTCRGTAQSLAIGDDVQLARYNGPVVAGGIVVLPGPNGTIESTPGGDDVLATGHQVTTDPLRRDTDSDLVHDGRERDLGGDPTNPFDAADFKDSDQDGLTDSEESKLGWLVSVNGGTAYLVLSNPSRPDTDADGLPDLAERIIATDPNRADTDGDGLTDFDELADFVQFRGLEEGNPGFFVDGAISQRYGTSPNSTDTDGDGLSDKAELVTGYWIMLAGESQPRFILTNPTVTDTDLDGVTDFNERFRSPLPTDATDPDTDRDGRLDGVERDTGTDPLMPDISATVSFGTIYLDKITDVGGTENAEIAWFYTVVRPDGVRVLVSNAADASYATGNLFVLGTGGAGCYNTEVSPHRNYTIPLNKSLTMTLRPGQSFKLEGILFEGDEASADCGKAPNYIPSSVKSGCVTRFSETFSFDDFDSAGRANFPFPTGQGTAESCNWTQEIFVTAR